MNRPSILLTSITLTASFACLFGCGSHKNTVSLGIVGMSCANCANEVAEHLKEVPGVRSASVNFSTKQAKVTLDAQHPASMEQLESAVDAWRKEHGGTEVDEKCLNPEARKAQMKGN